MGGIIFMISGQCKLSPGRGAVISHSQVVLGFRGFNHRMPSYCFRTPCWLVSATDSQQCNLSPPAAWDGRGILTLLPFQTVSNPPLLSAVEDEIHVAPPPSSSYTMSGPFGSIHGFIDPYATRPDFLCLPTLSVFSAYLLGQHSRSRWCLE